MAYAWRVMGLRETERSKAKWNGSRHDDYYYTRRFELLLKNDGAFFAAEIQLVILMIAP